MPQKNAISKGIHHGNPNLGENLLFVITPFQTVITKVSRTKIRRVVDVVKCAVFVLNYRVSACFLAAATSFDNFRSFQLGTSSNARLTARSASVKCPLATAALIIVSR